MSAVGQGRDWSAAISGLSSDAAGNGSLLRVAPVALPASTAEAAAALARLQSEVTHPNADCQDACAVFARAIWVAVETGVRPALAEVATWATTRSVRDAVVAAGGPTPEMSGWVLRTLTGALWR